MTDASTLECVSCGAAIAPGDDFCRECGHSVDFGRRVAGDELDDDFNAGVVCPSCGATHMVRTADGRFVCESCGHQL